MSSCMPAINARCFGGARSASARCRQMSPVIIGPMVGSERRAADIGGGAAHWLQPYPRPTPAQPMSSAMSIIFSEWGPEGAAAFDGIAAAVIVVDILSFSTCVDIAVDRGATVYPHACEDDGTAARLASSLGAELAGRRGSGNARFSLSPASLLSIEQGT